MFVPLRIGGLSVKSSNCRPNFALIITEQKLRRKGVMCNPGDVCCARNIQFSQSSLGLRFGHTVSTHDRKDGIGDISIAEYFV